LIVLPDGAGNIVPRGGRAASTPGGRTITTKGRMSVRYGMRPGISTGTHIPSPQAQKDGFKEN
jgi:hypothetical protein